NDCYILNEDEKAKVEKTVIDIDKGAVNPAVVGQSPHHIAKLAGVDVPEDTKILVAPIDGVGPDYPLSREKLSPVLALYVVDGADEGIKRAHEIISFGGLGHSAVIHSEDEDVIDRYSNAMKAGRIIVNSPSSHGAIGDIYNTNMPSLTL